MEAISEDSSGWMVKDAACGCGGCWFELESVFYFYFFSNIFVHLFNPGVTVLLEYPGADPEFGKGGVHFAEKVEDQKKKKPSRITEESRWI